MSHEKFCVAEFRLQIICPITKLLKLTSLFAGELRQPSTEMLKEAS